MGHLAPWSNTEADAHAKKPHLGLQHLRVFGNPCPKAGLEAKALNTSEKTCYKYRFIFKMLKKEREMTICHTYNVPGTWSERRYCIINNSCGKE